MSSDRYEVIIVGSGAGGAAASYSLVRAGKRVLMLEKGRHPPRDGSTLDTRQVFKEGKFKNKERWFDGGGAYLVPDEYCTATNSRISTQRGTTRCSASGRAEAPRVRRQAHGSGPAPGIEGASRESARPVVMTRRYRENSRGGSGPYRRGQRATTFAARFGQRAAAFGPVGKPATTASKRGQVGRPSVRQQRPQKRG